jgi:hypothetical protein
LLELVMWHKFRSTETVSNKVKTDFLFCVIGCVVVIYTSRGGGSLAIMASAHLVRVELANRILYGANLERDFHFTTYEEEFICNEYCPRLYSTVSLYLEVQVSISSRAPAIPIGVFRGFPPPSHTNAGTIP